MALNKYQHLASRTINAQLTNNQMLCHALHGIAAEAGELHGIHQKVYQDVPYDSTHAKKELGDLLWFIAEYATAHGWTLDEIAGMNIDKLLKRYPDGYDA